MKRLVWISAWIVTAGLGSAGAITCTPGAGLPLVRAEGLTEVIGDIALACSGTPGEVFGGSIGVFLSVNVTNPVSALGIAGGVTLTANGAPTGVPAVVMGANAIAFNGLSASVPSSGSLALVISGIRAAVAQRSAPLTPVTAALSVNGALISGSGTLSVALPMRALLAGTNGVSVNCYGSPVPATISMSGLIETGTAVSSTRVAEGFASAFETRSPGAASGVRIVLAYTGFPPGARLFVPDVIAGSDAITPTAGGDLGLAPSGGSYAPGPAGSLLLARVAGADASGAGGAPVYTPGTSGSPAVTFYGASAVELVSGAGTAVYEVMDANAALRESAQIPTFLSFPAGGTPGPTSAVLSVSFGPVSSVATATSTDPVPRFVVLDPALGCEQTGDCASFPRLQVNQAKPLTFTAVAGGRKQSGFASVENIGGGVIAWNLTVSYKTGAGWISLYAEPNLAYAPGWFRVDVYPSRLAPGVYEATVTVDAGGTAGVASLPVTLTVNPAPVPAGPKVDSVVNGASLAAGPVVPGSLAAVQGSGLDGQMVSVTFDGVAARIVSRDSARIDVVVPEELGARASAQVLVSVDGVSSAPATVALAGVAPAIFNGGILNQDNTLNGATSPAAPGSVIQIFATGLPGAAVGTISARIHDREVTAPDYAGIAPANPGLQQVNLRVPADLPAMTTEVLVCGTAAEGRKVCSPPASVTLGP